MKVMICINWSIYFYC